MSELPVVAVIGRPNVGKSTLFNRIVGEQAAIVEDRPGITRDRKELEAEWLGVPFRVIDTGGWSPGGSDLESKVSRQVEAAVRSSDVVLFVVDGSTLTTGGAVNPTSTIGALAVRAGEYIKRNHDHIVGQRTTPSNADAPSM